MARQKTADRKPAVEPAEQYVPSWQQDSVDRSLRNAIERARKRSDRFVEAAVELLSERDEGDFSIQDVVDRSGQSQRTFYTFFDSKDSLMLAVYETILRKNVAAIRASSVSLMPDGLEEHLSKQNLADLIAYLRGGM